MGGVSVIPWSTAWPALLRMGRSGWDLIGEWRWRAYGRRCPAACRFALCSALALGGGACSMPIGLARRQRRRQDPDRTGSIAVAPATATARRPIPISRPTTDLPKPISPLRAPPFRSARPRRQGHQRPVGKSENRRARHRDADRQRLHPGRLHLPRFPGELSCAPDRKPGCRAKPAACIRAAGKCAS